MKIKIEIECDTAQEFINHLNKIGTDTNKLIKKLGINRLEDELPKTNDLDDNNCYGWHHVTIKPS